MVVPEFGGITAAVEGDIDEAVVRSLIEYAQAKTRAVYGRNGKTHLQQRLSGYNQAARFSPWIVLVDLDRDAECALPFGTHGCLTHPPTCASALRFALWRHGSWPTGRILQSFFPSKLQESTRR